MSCICDHTENYLFAYSKPKPQPNLRFRENFSFLFGTTCFQAGPRGAYAPEEIYDPNKYWEHVISSIIPRSLPFITAVRKRFKHFSLFAVLRSAETCSTLCKGRLKSSNGGCGPVFDKRCDMGRFQVLCVSSNHESSTACATTCGDRARALPLPCIIPAEPKVSGMANTSRCHSALAP
ncbi:hypothetical protein TNCV_2860061 [Trichonephila clavipes]|nr:hypothetical protein TNCV_2860061 [Trichonephila clavipes]